MAQARPDPTPEVLGAESVEELPDREAISLIDANVAVPINAGVALDRGQRRLRRLRQRPADGRHHPVVVTAAGRAAAAGHGRPPCRR